LPTDLSRKRKILVAPLDWGLGHATRMIPLIHALQSFGAEVLIASDGQALSLLKKEFPTLACINLPGYRVHYQKKGSLGITMLLQLPKILAAIRAEKKWLKKIISKENIDAVISDNRFGMYTKDIPCIFVTHQINIIAPSPFKWMERWINKVNRRLIANFDACWIPDFEKEPGLSGALSHNFPLPDNAVFIGPLSRFSYREVSKRYKLMVLLSGPEPQRSILEQQLLKQFKEYAKLKNNQPTNDVVAAGELAEILFVRGIPEGSGDVLKISPGVIQVDYLLTEALNSAILESEIIISRPGYTTVMDLSLLGSRAIFIPTPGQPEQEYLAEYLTNKGICYTTSQSSFDLELALFEEKAFAGFKANSVQLWKQHLVNLLASIPDQ
jgi:uncharacterized protein (TIGR00661 family)